MFRAFGKLIIRRSRVGSRTRRRTGGLQQRLYTIPEADCTEKWSPDDELPESSKHVENEWRLPMKIKDSPQVTSCWLFFKQWSSLLCNLPIPMAARSKAWVCFHALGGIAGLNPVDGMNVCLLWVLCLFRYRSFRRADHSSGGVLQSVVCLSVIVTPRQWEGPGPLRAVAPWGGGCIILFLLLFLRST